MPRRIGLLIALLEVRKVSAVKLERFVGHFESTAKVKVLSPAKFHSAPHPWRCARVPAGRRQTRCIDADAELELEEAGHAS